MMLSNIGARIRELRKARGLSGKQLAMEIDVSQSFLSCLESGTKKCSLENLDAICTALGVSLSEFFREDKPEEEVPTEIRELLSLGLSSEQLRLIVQLAKNMK